jgi:SAM-dependent methyltransferase
MTKKDWFTDWFDTPYYHILYSNRNDADAELFIKNMVQLLRLPKKAHILDLPCGKGRHAVFLNALGYKVTGGDLSQNSILEAKQFENQTLNFEVHDMRKPFGHTYDAIFNLFTSFGYFEDDKEDLLILKNIKNGLTKEGVFVFDFLNADGVKATLVKSEIKTVDGITFHIQREIKDGFIFKYISFSADGKIHNYTERVKYLDLERMTRFLVEAGFKITNTFGDYHLNNFDKQTSNRLIIIAK